MYIEHGHITNNLSDEPDGKFIIGGRFSQDIFCLNFSTQDY